MILRALKDAVLGAVLGNHSHTYGLINTALCDGNRIEAVP